MESNQRWHFELEEQDDGPVFLRAVAICNGTTYKSKPQRLCGIRRTLVALLCLHSLTARLVSLMYNQRHVAFDIIRSRGVLRGDVVAAMNHLSAWLDRYGRRVDWNVAELDKQWNDYRRAMRGIICDLDTVAPNATSPFFDNYKGKLQVIYSIATSCSNIEDFPGLIPEMASPMQLSLF